MDIAVGARLDGREQNWGLLYVAAGFAAVAAGVFIDEETGFIACGALTAAPISVVIPYFA